MLKVFTAIALVVCLLAPCVAAESTQPTTTKPAASTKPKQSRTAAKATTSTKAASPTESDKPSTAVKQRPKSALRTEAEISGLTSETSDQIHGRLSFSKATPQRKWWVKTGGGYTVSRTYNNTTQETNISSFNVDTEYRYDGNDTYRFVSCVANVKTRSPHRSTYYDKAGYYMLSAGYGKTILRGMDCEVALAHITQQKGEVDRRLTPVYTLRMKSPLSSTLTLDSDTHIVQPGSDDSLVDSRVNLTYKLTSALSMRCTYVANNILGATLTKANEWDKSFRISLVFSGGGM